MLPPQANSPVIATYTADLILFIRPDIAAVKIRQRPADRAELMAAHPEAVPGTPTYVLTKDGGLSRSRPGVRKPGGVRRVRVVNLPQLLIFDLQGPDRGGERA
ncbi:hypothetical protein [Streptomyces griseus]|uniref:hypothetical protein n=1 Tax=Streptomyces griseus TaxID=1911 RepID=UPI00374E1530